VLTPPGGLDRPLSNRAILDKYNTLTGAITGHPRRDRIRELLLGLDDDSPVRELTALLNGTVGALLRAIR
jgi:hypothetical protein